MRFAGALAENTQLLFIEFYGGTRPAETLRRYHTTDQVREMTRLDIRDSFCLSMAAAVENRKQHGANASSGARKKKSTNKKRSIKKRGQLLQSNSRGEPTATATQTQVPDDLDSESYPTPTATNASTKDQAVATDKPFTSQTVVNLQIPMGHMVGLPRPGTPDDGKSSGRVI